MLSFRVPHETVLVSHPNQKIYIEAVVIHLIKLHNRSNFFHLLNFFILNINNLIPNHLK